MFTGSTNPLRKELVTMANLSPVSAILEITKSPFIPSLAADSFKSNHMLCCTIVSFFCWPINISLTHTHGSSLGPQGKWKLCLLVPITHTMGSTNGRLAILH